MPPHDRAAPGAAGHGTAGSLDRVRVVLVRPQSEGNVGAAARAMLNMGLRDLVIVAPRIERSDPVRWMAHGAGDVIDGMRAVPDLPRALADTTVAVATTARTRRWRTWPILDPPEAARVLCRAAADGRAAIVFGPEDTGLTNDDLACCTHLARIPTAGAHTSLNLAQAVMVLAYELFRTSRAPARGRARAPADAGQVDGALEQMAGVLDRVGFFRGRNRTQVLSTARQVLTRTALTRDEIGFLRGVMRKVSWGLDHPDDRD